MLRRITSAVSILLLAVILAGTGYVFRAPLLSSWDDLRQAIAPPCSVPIAYSLGTVDPRFHLSPEQFLANVQRAQTAWEKPINRELFRYVKNGGGMKINLVYDIRQDATLKLKSLGIAISNDRKTYDDLRTKYDSVYVQYQDKKRQLDAAAADLAAAQSSYNSQVEMWNRRGGAPKNVYDQLEAERVSIFARTEELRAMQTDVNSMVDELNAMVAVINQLASELNLAAGRYNTIGDRLGDAFEEGEYRRDASGRTIDIYQYDDQIKLLRVLEHELGHALGIGHLDEPAAIMYPSNQGTNLKATAADVAALRSVCGIK